MRTRTELQNKDTAGLKGAIAQALILRGSADFESVDAVHGKFVRRIVDRRNRLIREKLAREYPHLRELPSAPVPEYVSYSARGCASGAPSG